MIYPMIFKTVLKQAFMTSNADKVKILCNWLFLPSNSRRVAGCPLVGKMNFDVFGNRLMFNLEGEMLLGKETEGNYDNRSKYLRNGWKDV